MADRQQAREVWLRTAVVKLRPVFSAAGYEVPSKVAVSCGWPSSRATAGRKRAIGEAWGSTASRDKHFEIFISPVLDDGLRVLEVLVHELVHVTVGLEAGHKGRFAQCARAVGLEGKMTATVAGDVLCGKLRGIVGKIGKYPHGSLEAMTNAKKKQKARLVKVYCVGCSYTLRAAMSWLVVGIPECPNPDCVRHGEGMEVEGLTDADPQDG